MAKSEDMYEVKKILEKYNVLNMYDMSGDETDENLKRETEKASKFYGEEIPSRKSIHTYKFSENTDVRKLCQELRLNL